MLHALFLAAVVHSDTLRLPSVPREFRGVWVATVGNIDWPSKPGLPVTTQQEELIAILDRAQSLHLNAVIFQVRPAGDALYESQIEPWSEYLSGRQGVAPEPRWDPLKFAVDEAHARGLELHAWFNPSRAKDASAKCPLTIRHIGVQRPSAMKRYGTVLWMDPSDSVVRRHTVRVVLDVVRRYDIDGVHIDDYFYPYPQRDWRGRAVSFPDAAAYERYRKNGGGLDLSSWRRQNVDQLVEALYRGVRDVKPWVKFGISPFGIWRPGEPAGVEGFDAYEEIFADARRWLREGWADYFSPQLYWPVDSPAQNYSVLLNWWGEQNLFGRHIWPGNFTSRAGTRWDWPARELVSQVLATRADRTATGNVHFSMRALLKDQAGVAEALVRNVYAGPALVPESPWLAGQAPNAPRFRIANDGPLRVRACFGDPSLVAPRWWVLHVKRDHTWTTRVLPGAVRQMALGALSTADSVVLSAVDRTGREGGATVGEWTENC
jgi:uncharacterized lipoprotein YddW (UPF0748 family)